MMTTKPRDDIRRDVTSDEMMDRLGISRATLSRIVACGRAHKQDPNIPERTGYEGMPLPYRRGKHLYWPRRDTERWIARTPL